VSEKQGAKIIELNSATAIKPASAAAAASEINWQVISGGGTDATSTNFGLQGTIGQVATSSGASTNFILNHGYWQTFDFAGGVCGEVNGDGAINIGDVVFVINYIFREGPPSDPLCLSDANGDGAVNIGDPVFIISYIFREGPPPVTDCCP